MRLDLFIHFLNSERPVSQTGSARFDEILVQQEQVLEEADQRGFAVHLSGKSPSESQLLAQKVALLNEKKSVGKMELESEKVEVPPAVSSVLDKPEVEFDKFFEGLFSDPTAVIRAHGDFDRDRLVQLFQS